MSHPAADRVTAEALIVEQDRSVVPLSAWLADAAVTAGTSDRVMQVLTPATSRITYPLELLITDGGGQWVVREARERFRDGLTGVPLRWNGGRFAPVDGAPSAPPDEASPRESSIEVQVTTLHPATDALQLGACAEATTHALTGAAPTGWGVSEPVAQPWSPREITSYCRDRAPDPSSLVVVGGEHSRSVVSAVDVSRVDTGVLERVRVAGPASTSIGQDTIESLTETVAGFARFMLVAVHPGRSGGLRSNKVTPPALPYGVLFGPSVVAERGVDHASRAPAARVRLLDSGSRQAVWCRLDDGDKAPYELLTDVFGHFGLADVAGS